MSSPLPTPGLQVGIAWQPVPSTGTIHGGLEAPPQGALGDPRQRSACLLRSEGDGASQGIRCCRRHRPNFSQQGLGRDPSGEAPFLPMKFNVKKANLSFPREKKNIPLQKGPPERRCYPGDIHPPTWVCLPRRLSIPARSPALSIIPGASGPPRHAAAFPPLLSRESCVKHQRRQRQLRGRTRRQFAASLKSKPLRAGLARSFSPSAAWQRDGRDKRP